MTAAPKSAEVEAQAFADELKLAALQWHHTTPERDLMDRALLTIWNLQRALAVQTPAAEGWKLVRVEPTEAMISKALAWFGAWSHLRAQDRRNAIALAWSAMLSASPPPAAGAEDAYARGIEDAAKVAEQGAVPKGELYQNWDKASVGAQIAAAIRLLVGGGK